jgi:hypothetical protein
MITVGWMIPLLVGVMIDLYVFMPTRYSNSAHPAVVLHLFQDWSFGVLYLGILHGIIHILPTNTWQRTVDLYISNGLVSLDVWKFSKTALAPWFLGSTGTILFPGTMAWAMIKILGNIEGC